MSINKNQVYGAILGGIVGDALGVPYEFLSRSEITENPITKMIGYGTYNQPPGTWSDDTSMTLALIDSINENNGINYTDMMDKFSAWLYEAKYTPHNETFDVGRTTQYTIDQYRKGIKALECGLDDDHSNGNGSLMRIIPVCLYLYANGYNIEDTCEIIKNVSSLTHAHPISYTSCNIYNILVYEILNNPEMELKEILINAKNKARNMYDGSVSHRFNRLFSDNFFNISLDELESTGFVLNALEIAFYCCYHTDNYKDAILMAANLGEDTDTNAKITGDVAGLYYGDGYIPDEYLKTLIKREYLEDMIDQFIETLEI